MAVKIKNTIVNGGMSGRDRSIGKVFSHREGKTYSNAKVFTQPTNNNTAAQQAVRAEFARSSRAWSGLTDYQRTSWNSAAPDWSNTDVFGIKKQSGKNLFTGVNARLFSAGMDLLDTAGTKSIDTDVDDVFQVVSPGVLELEFDMLTINTDERVQIRATGPKSAGTSVSTGYRKIKNITPASNQTIDITAEYSAIYGAPPAGSVIFIEIMTVGVGGNSVTGRFVRAIMS